MSKLLIRLRPSDLWRWEGTIDRGPYLLWGASLLGIKYGIDHFVSQVFFHRSWSLVNYFLPGTAVDIFALSPQDRIFFFTLLILALPFIWIGVVLTMRRLRAANLPVWFVKLFFVPFLNLLLFSVLCVLPTQEGNYTAKRISRGPDDKVLPTRRGEEQSTEVSGPVKRSPAVVTRSEAAADAAYSLVATVPFGALIAYFGSIVLQTYGWGLFVGLPFAMGMTSAYLYGRNTAKSFGGCFKVAFAATTLLGLGIFVWAWEGLVCLLMAAPIAYALAAMGALLGYHLQRRKYLQAESQLMMLVLLCLFPTLMGAEYVAAPRPPLIAVQSAIDVAAPPTVVWRHVIAFPELSPPKDLLFKLGIAYPIGATISGNGVGAVRRCNFSTGAFIEPITAWQEPRLLQFGVRCQPKAMRETSLVKDLEPAHLQGYLDVKAGQFELTEIRKPKGLGTRLIGTTWYSNRMWPDFYWQLWSDYIIHRIHIRVLEHVKEQAESQTPIGIGN